MRSNSGKDEGRNNMHDPTMRDRELRARRERRSAGRSRRLQPIIAAGSPRTRGSGSNPRRGRART